MQFLKKFQIQKVSEFTQNCKVRFPTLVKYDSKPLFVSVSSCVFLYGKKFRVHLRASFGLHKTELFLQIRVAECRSFRHARGFSLRPHRPKTSPCGSGATMEPDVPSKLDTTDNCLRRGSNNTTAELDNPLVSIRPSLSGRQGKGGA